jgi:hypothetical protein
MFTISSTGDIRTVNSLPATINAFLSFVVEISFTPTTVGPAKATVFISTSTANVTIPGPVILSAISTNGLGGSFEPSLQWVFDALDIPIHVGDDNTSDPLINSIDTNKKSLILGDEITTFGLFSSLDASTPVTVECIAVYGPTTVDPVVRFGYYVNSTSNGAEVINKAQLFSVSNKPPQNGQSLYPNLTIPENNPQISTQPLQVSSVTTASKAPSHAVLISVNNVPPTVAFGFYSEWPFFDNRTIYTEDSRNTFVDALPHHVRVYKLVDNKGVVVPNAYVLATEETTTLDLIDFNDVVVIVRNVQIVVPKPVESSTVAPTLQTVTAETSQPSSTVSSQPPLTQTQPAIIVEPEQSSSSKVILSTGIALILMLSTMFALAF